jgi:hypothetical protein
MSAPRRLNRDDGRIGTGTGQKRRVRPSFAPSATKTAALSRRAALCSVALRDNVGGI